MAKPLLLVDDLSQIRERSPEIAECFQDKKAYDTARRILEKGDGIGAPHIQTYLGFGDPANCPRSKPEIDDAIAAAKDAGIYSTIIAQVSDEIAQEQDRCSNDTGQREHGVVVELLP